MLAKRHRLTKKELSSFFRLRTSKAFFKEGLVLRVLPRRNEPTKWAFVVSSSIKKTAVVRNTTRRRMNEIAHILTPRIAEGWWIVFFLKLSQKTPPRYRRLEEDMVILLKQCGVLS